jgi:hypothetical protein
MNICQWRPRELAFSTFPHCLHSTLQEFHSKAITRQRCIRLYDSVNSCIRICLGVQIMVSVLDVFV